MSTLRKKWLVGFYLYTINNDTKRGITKELAPSIRMSGFVVYRRVREEWSEGGVRGIFKK